MDKFKSLFKEPEIVMGPKPPVCDSIDCNNTGPLLIMNNYQLCQIHSDLYDISSKVRSQIDTIELTLNLVSSLKILGHDLTAMRAEQNEIMTTINANLMLPNLD